MWSPPPPPLTSPPRRRGDADQPTTSRLSRHRHQRRRRRPQSTTSSVLDRVPSPTPANHVLLAPVSYAGAMGHGIDTFPQSVHDQELTSHSMFEDWYSLLPRPGTDVGVQSQHQEEQESGSELDSPPRITMLPEPDIQEPDSPTSPPGSPCSVRVNPTGPPKDIPNDEEDQYFNHLVENFVSVAANVFSSTLSDQYFNHLVENFVSVAANVFSSTLSDDEIDYKTEIHQQSVLCAESALKHYNNDEKNKIKYCLISVSMCNDILIREGVFSHINFTAKENQLNAKEEFFFAELRWDHNTPVPTCVVCFKGIKKIGGLRDSKYDKFYLKGLPIDTHHCYACSPQVKHPKDGELYSVSHVAMSKYYRD